MPSMNEQCLSIGRLPHPNNIPPPPTVGSGNHRQKCDLFGSEAFKPRFNWFTQFAFGIMNGRAEKQMNCFRNMLNRIFVEF